MRKLKMALVATLAGLTAYCGLTAPAFAGGEELCPRLPDTHFVGPKHEMDPDEKFDPDQRSIA